MTEIKVPLGNPAPGDMVGLDEISGDAVPTWIHLRARRGASKAWRWMDTSEGIEVAMPLAPLGARIYGWFLDQLIIIGLAIGCGIAGAIIGAVGLPGVGMSIALVLIFLLRYFYFVVLETLWQGRTPGKRAARTRVVDRRGLPLTVEAIFVRNVTRDLEVLIPLVALFQPRAIFPNAPGWGLLLSGLWLVVIALFPLFNRDRLRIGDLLAGTVVVRTLDRVALWDDPAYGAFMRVRNERPVYAFSPEQLDMYGIFEVQTLEDVLTQGAGKAPPDEATLAELGRTIRRKVGWSGDGKEISEWQFLHDFYASLRARHERRLMLGQRQPFKREGSLETSAATQMVVQHRQSAVLPAVRPTSHSPASGGQEAIERWTQTQPNPAIAAPAAEQPADTEPGPTTIRQAAIPLGASPAAPQGRPAQPDDATVSVEDSATGTTSWAPDAASPGSAADAANQVPSRPAEPTAPATPSAESGLAPPPPAVPQLDPFAAPPSDAFGPTATTTDDDASEEAP